MERKGFRLEAEGIPLVSEDRGGSGQGLSVKGTGQTITPILEIISGLSLIRSSLGIC